MGRTHHQSSTDEDRRTNDGETLQWQGLSDPPVNCEESSLLHFYLPPATRALFAPYRAVNSDKFLRNQLKKLPPCGGDGHLYNTTSSECSVQVTAKQSKLTVEIEIVHRDTQG